MSDKIMLTLYLNIGNMDGSDINEHCQSVSKSMFPKELMETMNAIVFIIPVRDTESRLECIHPSFVLDADVYQKHTDQMKELNEKINIIINKENL